MKCSRNPNVKYQHVTIGKHQFENVQTFKYLGREISNKNERTNDIKQRLQVGNKLYSIYKKLLKNKKISKKTKMRVYTTIIRPAVMYAAETITLTKREEEQLRIFERKVIRTIVGGVKIGEHEYRRKTNNEILQEIKGEDLVRAVKSQRLRWFGHITRADENKAIKILTRWKPYEDRPRARPKKRWIDEIMNDMRKMKIGNWKNKAYDRTQWKNIVKIAKSHKNL